MIGTDVSKIRIYVECHAPAACNDNKFIQALERVVRSRLELNSNDIVKIEVIK